MGIKDPSRFQEPHRSTDNERSYRAELEEYFSRSIGSNVEKLQNFAKYVPVQDARKFLARYEIFRRIEGVHGSIFECGVLFGGGVMTWALLSEIFEPLNHLRNIVGFDTFSGFTTFAAEDKTAWHDDKKETQAKIGGLSINSKADIEESIRLYDKNRFLPHIGKVKLVQGDIRETAPAYIKENQHTVIALLTLDFDTYEPTLAALEHFWPRIPRGGIVLFDELNHEVWPGETIAVEEKIGIPNLKIQRLPWGPTMCFAVKE